MANKPSSVVLKSKQPCKCASVQVITKENSRWIKRFATPFLVEGQLVGMGGVNELDYLWLLMANKQHLDYYL